MKFDCLTAPRHNEFLLINNGHSFLFLLCLLPVFYSHRYAAAGCFLEKKKWLVFDCSPFPLCGAPGTLRNLENAHLHGIYSNRQRHPCSLWRHGPLHHLWNDFFIYHIFIATPCPVSDLLFVEVGRHIVHSPGLHLKFASATHCWDRSLLAADSNRIIGHCHQPLISIRRSSMRSFVLGEKLNFVGIPTLDSACAQKRAHRVKLSL